MLADKRKTEVSQEQRWRYECHLWKEEDHGKGKHKMPFSFPSTLVTGGIKWSWHCTAEEKGKEMILLPDAQFQRAWYRMLGVLELCISSGTAWTSWGMRNPQALLRDGDSAFFCLLLPTQVPDNTKAVNPIKGQRFLEANTEVLTSGNAAELWAFLVLAN